MTYASLLGLATILLGSAFARASEPLPPPLETARCLASDFSGRAYLRGKVVRAIDGDTIKLAVGHQAYNVRFLSVDTPETKFQGKSQGYWGERAHDRLAGLLPVGVQVTIHFDREKCDRYGRVLGYVHRGNRDINYMMANEGLAVTYCIAPNLSRCERYGRATERALADERGFFQDPSVELPYDWRRIESGRPREKFVGDIRTGRVYRPTQVYRVPVGYRVFFLSEQDIRPPYYLPSRD